MRAYNRFFVSYNCASWYIVWYIQRHLLIWQFVDRPTHRSDCVHDFWLHFISACVYNIVISSMFIGHDTNISTWNLWLFSFHKLSCIYSIKFDNFIPPKSPTQNWACNKPVRPKWRDRENARKRKVIAWFSVLLFYEVVYSIHLLMAFSRATHFLNIAE